MVRPNWENILNNDHEAFDYLKKRGAVDLMICKFCGESDKERQLNFDTVTDWRKKFMLLINK